MVNVLDKVQPKNKRQLKQLINYAFKHNIYDLNFIDTSEITDMSLLFSNCMHNFDVSSWDVANGTCMEYMFVNCKNFNCDLSYWDVSNVTDMDNMFYNCKKFNCDLSDWDISNMTRWKNTFYGCDKMTIPNWYKLYHKK